MLTIVFGIVIGLWLFLAIFGEDDNTPEGL